MYIEMSMGMSDGKDGRHQLAAHGIVHWDKRGSIKDIEYEVRERGLTTLVFADSNFFDDHERAMEMCCDMRIRDMNVLWSAQIAKLPTEALLKVMRMAGCQHIDVHLDLDEAVEALALARLYGFDIRMCCFNAIPYASEKTRYTVAEREAIAHRLPGLHTAQFDLAVSYFNARRFTEVMLPLGKAMTLRFPKNDLCLNLLACLSAAKHYPDQAAGLLDQAGYGCPHPVVFRNRKILKSWLESGGDLKGVRLKLESQGAHVLA